MSTKRLRAKAALIILMTTCSTSILAAGDDSDGKFDHSSLQNFTFHGYVNVGYGVADGHQHRGVSDGGGSDLHALALQMRFKPTRRDEFVLQFANETVGDSPSNRLRDELEIDWLYYRRELAKNTSLRVGRAPLPVGIYNQIKDVGTLLPFYRPSGGFYGDGTWTSDSIDGLILSHKFAAQSEWSVESDVYFGEWERIETDGGTLAYDTANIDDAMGFWLWFNTPASGLRFGIGANRFHSSGGVFLAPGATDTEETRYFSVDADFDRVVFRFEHSRREFTGGNWTPYYLELDVGLTERFRMTALYDRSDLLFEIPFFATFDGTIERIYGLGARFIWKPNVVFKLEHQWFKGYGQIEDRPLNIFFDDPVNTNVVVLSASYTF